jgi:hypothetical protein
MRIVGATEKLEGIRLNVADNCIKPNFARERGKIFSVT